MVISDGELAVLLLLYESSGLTDSFTLSRFSVKVTKFLDITDISDAQLLVANATKKDI